MLRITTLIMTMIVFCLPLSALGAEKANKSSQPGKTTDTFLAIKDYALALDMAEYGEAQNNPLVLLAAAQVLKGTEVAFDEDIAVATTPEHLLVSAQKMAGKNLKLLSMIKSELKRQSTRGSIEGPAKHVSRINSNRADKYNIQFLAGERAAVYVKSTEPGIITLSVYDEEGNLIAEDTAQKAECMVQWTPDWDGIFTVEVKNIGHEADLSYLMLTN